jgi:hypothetical protein
MVLGHTDGRRSRPSNNKEAVDVFYTWFDINIITGLILIEVDFFGRIN